MWPFKRDVEKRTHTNDLNHLKKQEAANKVEAQLRVAKAKIQGKEAYVYEVRAWRQDINYVLVFDHVLEYPNEIKDPYVQLDFPFASNWELRLLASTD